jgi:translation elongation factor EF-Tu-like GTPase
MKPENCQTEQVIQELFEALEHWIDSPADRIEYLSFLASLETVLEYRLANGKESKK